jgi:hypothetical protein
MDIEPSAILIFLGTVLGGVGLRYIDHLLTRKRQTLDEGAAWRKELRDESNARKQEIDELEAEVDKWRTMYYDLRDKYTLLKVQLELALTQIKNDADVAKNILPDPAELPPPHDHPEG